ncbi:MAG: hypothetical protein EOM68_14545 [Spirochaetia bacterium]|nr:hypothetical protein [Spirochaetia bacterium]
MPDNMRVISNQEELEQYFSELCRDITQVAGQVVDFEHYTQGPLVIKISGSPGDGSSMISTSWMKTFLKLQDSVYSIFAIVKGEPLTQEDKDKLEIKVKVQSGCTEFLLELWKIFMEAAKDMSVPQILAFTLPAAVAYAGAIFLKSRRDERIEIHKADVEAQLETKRIELQNSDNLERERAHIKALEIVRDIVIHTEKAEKFIYKALYEESKMSDISIDGHPMPPEELKELARTPRSPREDARTKVIEDHFIVSVMDFSGASGMVASLKGTAPEHEFKGVIIPDDLLNDEELAIFSHAKGRAPMHLRLTVKDKKGVLSDPTLIQKLD